METRPSSEMGKVAVAVGTVAMLAAEPGEFAFPKLFHFCRQSRPGTADLGGVTDFLAAQGTGPGAPRVVKSQLNVSPASDHDAYRAGLRLASEWRAYGLQGYPGFIFIPNPCSQVKQCLKLYSRKPNLCNLDKHVTKKRPKICGNRAKSF